MSYSPVITTKYNLELTAFTPGTPDFALSSFTPSTRSVVDFILSVFTPPINTVVNFDFGGAVTATLGYINIFNSWKVISNVYMAMSGTWKDVSTINVLEGAWKDLS